MQRELERLSSTDEVTGLYNRRFFLSHLRRHLESPYRSGNCLLLLDIDNFKHINDTYGHEVGNKALGCCARTMRQALRDIDILARFGGEEFVVLLPDTPREQAATIAERIRARVAQTPLELQQPVTMTLRIGCASSTLTSDMADLIREADRALYRAKHRGRNRVEVAAGTHGPARGRLVPKSLLTETLSPGSSAHLHRYVLESVNENQAQKPCTLTFITLDAFLTN